MMRPAARAFRTSAVWSRSSATGMVSRTVPPPARSDASPSTPTRGFSPISALIIRQARTDHGRTAHHILYFRYRQTARRLMKTAPKVSIGRTVMRATWETLASDAAQLGLAFRGAFHPGPEDGVPTLSDGA